MTYTLIIGGGLAGCTVARELAEKGQEVIIIEKKDGIGGKVKDYGCKATEQCNNCGLCLVGDLWETIELHPRITILSNTQLKDVWGTKGDFKVQLKTANGIKVLEDISNIVVSTGFKDFSQSLSGNLEIKEADNIISGSELERIFVRRKKNEIFRRKPESIAFIQCFGSRDLQQHTAYCSKVCCAYSTRTARVLKYFYPDIKIAFFYMDLQKVEEGEYFSYLSEQKDMEFIKCRPVKVEGGNPGIVMYEEPGSGGIREREFDMIVLSNGIYPSEDNDKLAELCTLGIDKDGFLKNVRDGDISGVYLAGCASGPKKIEEVYSESVNLAQMIIRS